MILVNKYILRVLTGEFASAITIWPFIFLREQRYTKDSILLNHEKIHLKQQLETLILFFYFIYAFDYLRNRRKGMNPRTSYFNIRFEQEAYAYEKDLTYLSKRKAYNWWRM
ncbi:MAG: hypothetical protein IPG95_00105 [Saprospiraceae bacterium]|nr:hypothetical protein [Saprospiraceae bacterium]